MGEKKGKVEMEKITLGGIMKDSLLDSLFTIENDIIIIDKPSVKWPVIKFIQEVLTAYDWSIDEIYISNSEEVMVHCKQVKKVNEDFC